MIRKDYRATPVRRMVVMGESNAYGMCAGDAQNEWVQVVAAQIRRFQDGSLLVFNNAIPSNVVGPSSPGYDQAFVNGTAPSAVERFRQDMVDYQPDLAVYAYGLNDSRCGHSVNGFISYYETILTETRCLLPDALIVLVGPYWNIQYDAGLWARSECAPLHCPPFDVAGDKLALQYNAAIAELAERVDAIFVDAYHATEGSVWLLHDDGCHFNDIGQALIGRTVFGALAANCSFLSVKSIEASRMFGLSVPTTGGTNALPRVISTWRRTKP